jgi:hypothetical protein
MKTNLFILAAAASVLLASSGCSDDRDFLSGEGSVIITPSFNTDVKVVSRASLEEELSDSFILWISSEKGLVRKYEGMSNVPADGVKLLGGNYVAEGWAGDSVSASFDSRYFKGRAPFTITSGVSRVELVCKIANVLASVKYDDSVDEVLSDYTMTVSHKRGSLDFEGRDERKGYFMMPTGVSDLTWTLTGKQSDGSTFTKTGTIADVKSATEYVLTVQYNPKEDQVGAGFITISVDETTVDVEDEIVITSAPTIKGVGYNIANTVYGEEGNIGKKSVYVTAATSLKNLVLESDALTPIISGKDVDLMTATSSVISSLENAGIDFTYNYDADNDISNLKLNFNDQFTATLTGETVFNISATDNNNKTTTAVLTINATDPTVEATSTSDTSADIWATQATIYGNVLKDTSDAVGFDYRQAGTSAWIHVDGVVSGRSTSYYATLTGLKAGTTYEYRATAGEFVSTTIYQFTTESAAQLPNCGFEDWSKNGKTVLVCADSDGKDMFWDSGNHGSSKMSKNLTTSNSDIKHGGNYSAELKSQFVGVGTIGAFAAGNVFVGQYLGEEDTTKGIIGWGREFTSRPSKLKGYVKYTPATVTYGATGVISVGDMDQGQIFIALVDDSKMSYGSYSGWPQIVATKDLTNYSFKETNSNVIAYGELIFTEATAGDGMVEFEIDLKYKRTDIKPSNIIVTCSASRYGDYYAGGPSVMYIDDFELVY